MAILSRFLSAQRHARIGPYVQGAVLDLGCGNARALKLYGSKITAYLGVERDEHAVQRLSLEFPDATFVHRNLDVEPLALDLHFDCILMIAIIEHLFNQRFVMEQVGAVLRPGGVVVVTTPTPFGNDIVHRAGARLGLFAEAAVDDHIVIYNRHRFRILAAEVGLHLKHHQYFQAGCNQLAILEKPTDADRVSVT